MRRGAARVSSCSFAARRRTCVRRTCFVTLISAARRTRVRRASFVNAPHKFSHTLPSFIKHYWLFFVSCVPLAMGAWPLRPTRHGVLQRTPAAKFTVRMYFGGNQHTALGEWVVRVNQSLQPYCTQSDLVIFITAQRVGPGLRSPLVQLLQRSPTRAR